MAHRYFALSEDVQPGHWYLGEPRRAVTNEEADPCEFTAGRPVSIQGHMKVPVTATGRPLDFSTAGISATPIVHVKVATRLSELAPDDVQFIPVDVEGQPDQYLILVATKLIRCIDPNASREVRYWKPEHGQPERVGEYRSVAGLRIDPGLVGSAKLFRTWGWDIALIVSEDLKVAIEQEQTTGARFTEV
ncbi:DUF1629 domain-containing protein [Myxococcus sp. AB036A]|uniref:imm11 family protein n=1 Tax=Myxococcus sp. AB036A TaxID=2562793 RepID=UPI0011463DE0|nr:DUF1629 domain-containing protein [Myxococcus sp. AB036A]